MPVVQKGQNQDKPVAICRHHWLIESAHGPTSMGICKFCGVEREFSNVPKDYVLAPQGAALQIMSRWPKRRLQEVSLEEILEGAERSA